MFFNVSAALCKGVTKLVAVCLVWFLFRGKFCKTYQKIPAVTHFNTLNCRNIMVFEKKKKKETQPLDSKMCPLISRYHVFLTAYKHVCDVDFISV